MNIEAEGCTCFHGRRLVEIIGRGDLAIVLMASNHDNLQACAFGYCGVVGQCRGLACRQRRGGAVRLEQGPESENLRGLRTPQAGARYGGRDDSAVVGALQGIGERHPQNGALDGRIVQSGETGGDIGSPDERAGCVVHRHQVRRDRGQCLQAVQHRVLATCAPFDRRWQVEVADSRPVLSLVVGTDDDLQVVDPGHAAKGDHGPTDHGFALKKGILLGQ